MKRLYAEEMMAVPPSADELRKALEDLAICCANIDDALRVFEEKVDMCKQDVEGDIDMSMYGDLDSSMIYSRNRFETLLRNTEAFLKDISK